MDKPYKVFSTIIPLTIQAYERYLPTAFDESLTLLQKMNKVLDFYNQVGALSNEMVAYINELTDYTESEINSVLAQFEEFKLDYLPTALETILDGWVTSGKLADALENKSGISKATKTINKMSNGLPVTIVAYGDSITYGYKSVDPDRGTQVTKPYPMVLQERLRSIYDNQNITVINSGVSGWQTDEALTNYDVKVKNLNPDLVILMFGINDDRGNVTFGPITPLADYKENIKQLTLKSKDLGYDVVLMTPNPILDQSSGFHKKLIDYANAMKEIAEIFSVSLVDLHQEMSQMFKNKVLAPKDVFLDNIHFEDSRYALIADVLLAKLFFTEPIAVIDSREEKTIPAFNSPYIVTDNGLEFNNKGQFFKSNHIMRNNGIGGTYLRFPFYVNAKGMNLVLSSPKNPDGGRITPLLDGVPLPYYLDFYSPDSHAFEVKQTLAENLSVGFHIIEFLSTNIMTGSSIGMYAATYFTEFIFEKNKSENNKKYITNVSAVVGGLEYYKSLLQGKLRFGANNTGMGTGALLTDQDFIELKVDKQLVFEVEGKFVDASAFTWFGNRVENGLENDPYQANSGYLLYVRGGAVTLYRCGLDNALTSIGVVTKTTDFNVNHKLRIEHNRDGFITVYMDDVSIITATDVEHIGGYCGVYLFNNGTIELDRMEYCHK